MKGIAVLLLASLSVPQVHTPNPRPHFVEPAYTAAHKGGRWYLTRTGHAVYCYGPVMTVSATDGGIERVATLCRDNKVMVPLKE